MSTITLKLPDSLNYKVKELAKADGITTDQFITIAVAEKMAALLTQSYLENEAKEGNRKDFDKVLKAVPHIEPEECDRI